MPKKKVVLPSSFKKNQKMKKAGERLMFLLSPAKTLNFAKTERPNLSFSNPALLNEVDPLVIALKGMSKGKLKSLLKVSDNINTLNYERYQAFLESDKSKRSKPIAEKFKQCILSYNGAAYNGLRANDLSDEDLIFCNKHLRIISGLYGVLRPLDLIQPYRLDFGLKLATENHKDLYSYWGDRCSKLIDGDVGNDGVVINVASNEYFKSVSKTLHSRVITCEFKDGGRIISVFAKRARGLMVKYAIEKRVQNVEDVKNFDLEGYTYDEKQSDANTFVFTRTKKAANSSSNGGKTKKRTAASTKAVCTKKKKKRK